MAAFNKLSEAMLNARVAMQTPAEDPYMTFGLKQEANLSDKDECPNPDCTYCGSGGECIFETCQIQELPKVDGSYEFECILCEEKQEADPMSIQGRARLCDDCLDKLLETHQTKKSFKCIICDESSNTRKIFGVNMCSKCFSELRSHIRDWRWGG